MSTRALIGAAMAALFAARPAAAEPFALEDVDFEADCAPNAAFLRLLTLLYGPPNESEAEPAYDAPLLAAVSGHATGAVHFAGERPWHGLRLVAVGTYHGIESGPSNHAMVFADSPERVREVWNARGWNLPPPGETRMLEDEPIAVAIGVAADGAGAAVTCSVD